MGQNDQYVPLQAFDGDLPDNINRDRDALRKVIAGMREDLGSLTDRVSSLERLRPIVWAAGTTDGAGGLTSKIIEGCTLRISGGGIVMTYTIDRPNNQYLPVGIIGGGGNELFLTFFPTTAGMFWRAKDADTGADLDLGVNVRDYSLIIQAPTL